MKQKSLLILSIVTAVALTMAALALRDKNSAASTAGRARLFPELSARINDIARVRVEKEGKSVTLQREGGRWELVDRGGYPALFEKVKELAVRLADLEIEEAKTSRKDNHAKLQLEWPPSSEGSDASTTARVSLADAAGVELASLVVGKSEWQGSKTKVFVRRASEDQVYLCSPRQQLALEADAKGWIEPKFVALPGDRVQSVTIEHADGERVEIGRSAANHTQFTVQNLPLGRSESYSGVANGVAQALSSMQLEDVRPAPEIDFSREPLARTSFHCADGLDLLVETARVDDKTWARIVAAYVPPPKDLAPAEGEGADSGPDQGAETKAEGHPEKPDIGKEAQELNQRLAAWAFQISSYKADQLAKRLKDLMAEPTPAGGDGGLSGLMDDLGVDTDESASEGPESLEIPPSPDDGDAPSAPDKMTKPE